MKYLQFNALQAGHWNFIMSMPLKEGILVEEIEKFQKELVDSLEKAEIDVLSGTYSNCRVTFKPKEFSAIRISVSDRQ